MVDWSQHDFHLLATGIYAFYMNNNIYIYILFLLVYSNYSLVEGNAGFAAGVPWWAVHSAGGTSGWRQPEFRRGSCDIVLQGLD